jgi:hypothetical protein
VNTLDRRTTDGLLVALRRRSDRPALAWASPPQRLSGGFWAEMYAVELADAPRGLDGRRRRAHAMRALVETATWEARGDLDTHRGHPWLTMRPTLEACLAQR